jgi:hypothetical protein
LLKKWDGCYVTVGSSLLAVGSTEEKAVSRAVGNRDDSATAAHKILPIAGCVSAAVAHDGKMHVMSVSFPSTPGLPAQYFAFTTPSARDAFMRALQAQSAALAAKSLTAAAASGAAAAFPRAAVEAIAASHDRAAAAARAEAECKATSARNAAEAVAAAPAIAHALQYEEFDQEFKEVAARIANNDPTMTDANLSGECAAADGAAAVALLQMQQGRERVVDCVCATEPLWCSSGVTDAGAAAIARALEKNTTLQTLLLFGEFVVLCCVCGGGLIIVYVVVGCCWFVCFGLRGVSVVLIVCAPLNRRVHQTTKSATRGLRLLRER